MPNPGRRKKTASRAVKGIDMEGDELLFELRSPNGQVWRLYLDGRSEGFPAGTSVENRAHPLWCALAGEMKKQSEVGTIQLQPIAGTHGDQFEARVGGDVVGAIGWRELAELTGRQLAKAAPSSIALKGDAVLVVYERRIESGLGSSDDALHIEIGQERIQLSERAARDLARVLLAYAGQENLRGQWLVRTESVQR